MEIFEAGHFFEVKVQIFLSTFRVGEQLRSDYVEKYPTHLASFKVCIFQTKSFVCFASDILDLLAT